VVAAAVLPTMSRGGYFALAAGLCTLGIAWMFSSRPRQRDNRKFLGWSVGLLLAALVLVALPGTRGLAVASWDRVETLGSAGRDESVVAHFDQWKVAAHIVVDHPLIGTGPSTLPTVFPSYSREVLEDDRVVYFDQFRVESAHNGMLDLATAGGLPLLLACAGVLLTAAWELARDVRSSGCQLRARLSAGLLAALATFVVANSFMTAEVTGSWVLWLMLGAATGSRRTRTGSASPLPTPR
jgi:O-antigen ligase